MGWGADAEKIAGYVAILNDFLIERFRLGAAAGHNTFFVIRKNAKLWRNFCNG